ncbi:MAG: hypothetical protein BWX51_01623 [Bacteroidetes bacterium ADurb.Bin012]|jgi:hypothetical protein|nr:MAG: hypothetical protein BWX51_01623 [Bacteroidetes bacterium ADurb.Bin012]
MTLVFFGLIIRDAREKFPQNDTISELSRLLLTIPYPPIPICHLLSRTRHNPIHEQSVYKNIQYDLIRNIQSAKIRVIHRFVLF